MSAPVPPVCTVSSVEFYPSFSASLTQHSGVSDVIKLLTFLPLVSFVVPVLSFVISFSVPPVCAVSSVGSYPSFSASLTRHSIDSDIIQLLTFQPLVSSVVPVLSSVVSAPVPPVCAVSSVESYPSFSASLTQHSGVRSKSLNFKLFKTYLCIHVWTRPIKVFWQFTNLSKNHFAQYHQYNM